MTPRWLLIVVVFVCAVDAVSALAQEHEQRQHDFDDATMASDHLGLAKEAANPKTKAQKEQEYQALLTTQPFSVSAAQARAAVLSAYKASTPSALADLYVQIQAKFDADLHWGENLFRRGQQALKRGSPSEVSHSQNQLQLLLSEVYSKFEQEVTQFHEQRHNAVFQKIVDATKWNRPRGPFDLGVLEESLSNFRALLQRWALEQAVFSYAQFRWLDRILMCTGRHCHQHETAIVNAALEKIVGRSFRLWGAKLDAYWTLTTTTDMPSLSTDSWCCDQFFTSVEGQNFKCNLGDLKRDACNLNLPCLLSGIVDLNGRKWHTNVYQSFRADKVYEPSTGSIVIPHSQTYYAYKERGWLNRLQEARYRVVCPASNCILSTLKLIHTVHNSQMCVAHRIFSKLYSLPGARTTLAEADATDDNDDLSLDHDGAPFGLDTMFDLDEDTSSDEDKDKDEVQDTTTSNPFLKFLDEDWQTHNDPACDACPWPDACESLLADNPNLRSSYNR